MCVCVSVYYSLKHMHINNKSRETPKYAVVSYSFPQRCLDIQQQQQSIFYVFDKISR